MSINTEEITPIEKDIKEETRGVNMIEEKRLELESHVKAIAAILYEDSKKEESERLKTLEGMEIVVREQVQKYVSAEIGFFY
jgi:hypothetical protein